MIGQVVTESVNPQGEEMNTGIVELLVFGLVAIVAGFLLLIGMVRELTSGARRKFILGVALGTGIIAFSLKIALVVVFSLFPGPMLTLFPERNYVPDRLVEENGGESSRKLAYTWRALPFSAPFPADNPSSAEKVALGKQLFFDTRLSRDGTLSCASCHEISVEKGGGDGRPSSVGIGGQKGDRNAPTVLNAAFQQVMFWDGRAASLEEQAKGPLLNPIEMGMPSGQSVVDKVSAIEAYQRTFSRVFNAEPSITLDNIAKAIAAFERTLITPDSPYDRFVRGERTALSERQLRGMALFESLGCVQCHSGPNFSGASLFGDNTPLRIFPAVPYTEFETQYRLADDRGAAEVSNESDRGVWRIPSLRNVNRTAPYFHNGSVKSLKEAVRIMARVQLDKRLSDATEDNRRISWSGQDRQLDILTEQAVTEAQIEDIVEFLKSLDGTLPTVTM